MCYAIVHSSAFDNVKYSPLIQKGQSTKHRLVKIGIGSKSESGENGIWLNSGLKSLNS